jgi:uncharacterized membrane protein
MTDSATSKQEEAFRAVLYPHRSLPRTGFVALMAALCVVSFVAGFIFYRIGAWPVPGFFGLDLLLIYAAFRLNYRSGRRYEIVDLTHDKLEVTRVAPSGRRESFSLNPYWARVRLTERVEGRSDLALAAHGREYRIGDFLSDDERREFASTLEAALHAARTPKFA